MPDPDRVVVQTPEGLRLRPRRFPSEGGKGGRAAVPRASGAFLLGRASAAEVRKARARFDLRKRRMRRMKRRAGRAPVEFRPGVRRAILDLHAQGVGYRDICRRLRLGVSYGTVRRVVAEIVAAARAEARRPLTIAELVKACGPGIVRKLRRAGVRAGAGAAALERARRVPWIADLLAEREGTWDRMIDAWDRT